MEELDDAATRALMEIHIDTLFVCDADGRLCHINEPGNPPAPRLYMGRTRHGNTWRVHHDLPATVCEELDELCRAAPSVNGPSTNGLASTPHHTGAIKAVLQRHAPIEREYRGPAYWVPETTSATTRPAAQVVLIAQDNADLLARHFEWMHARVRADDPADLGPVAAVIEQGSAVALCFCSRTPRQAAEAGVETVAAYRGRGYAPAAVATWANALFRQGIIALYSTTWDNVASQAVARKLRMVRYGEDWWIR